MSTALDYNKCCTIFKISQLLEMILTFTFLFAALGYLFYKSKDEIILLEKENTESKNIEFEEDDSLYKELEDLFI